MAMVRRSTLGAVLALTVAATACARPEPPHRLDARIGTGAELYTKYCALCHGPEGKGYAADHAPSLVSETFLASAGDGFLVRSIHEGRPGTAMAPYGRERGGPLTDDEVTSIIAYLRSRGPGRLVELPRLPPGDAARGQVLYDTRCQRCHGTVAERGEAPHLANPAFLAAAGESFLRYAILNGRPGTRMEPFRDTLDERSISDLVALLRSWATPPPPPPLPMPQMPPEPPLQGPIVINPGGKAPTFKLREERFVSVDQVKAALDAKNRMVLIDARAGSEWLITHIPGAISVAYYQSPRLNAIPKDDTWVIAYCACPHHASGVIIDELRRRGYPHTAVLDEGILEWQKRKYPLTPRAPGAPAAPGMPGPAAFLPGMPQPGMPALLPPPGPVPPPGPLPSPGPLPPPGPAAPPPGPPPPHR
jgi:cytochrome c oxidase cbb3-type subunit 3/ubiquinol-cytochrome c reductase cytochrome c subunit